MNSDSTPSHASGDAGPRPAAIGLPLVAVVGLALLAVPRVVLHDLDLVHEGTFVNLLLVFVPLIVWIAVVLGSHVRRPFSTLLTVGGVYGVLLATVHQLLWTVGTSEAPLRLGGNLADLAPGVQEVVFRVAGVGSSLVTGLVVGAVTGAVAVGIAALTRRNEP